MDYKGCEHQSIQCSRCRENEKDEAIAALAAERDALRESLVECFQHVKSWLGGGLPISHEEVHERLKKAFMEKHETERRVRALEGRRA